MTSYKTPKSAMPADLFSTTQFGVFQHNDPEDVDDAKAELVHMAADFNTAYEKLRDHAGDEIGQRPEWGATDEVTSSKTFDILGFDHKIRLRYEIAIVRPSNRNEDGEIEWVRERDWLANEEADGPKERIGMYVDLDLQDKSGTKHFLVGGFTSIDEASDAMKESALAYAANPTITRLLERSIELVAANGDIVQRYQIVTGSWQNGKFVKEASWVAKEAEVQAAAAYPTPDASFYSLRDAESATLVPETPTPDIPYASQEANASVSSEDSEDVEMAEDEDVARDENVAEDETVAEDQTLAEDENVEEDEDMTEAEDEPEVQLWCSCQQPDDGRRMIGCDDENCAIQWYHTACVGLARAPKGEWFCPTCAPAHAPKAKRGRPKKGKTGAGIGKEKAKTGAGMGKEMGKGKAVVGARVEKRVGRRVDAEGASLSMARNDGRNDAQLEMG
jgi:hypothetical protein